MIYLIYLQRKVVKLRHSLGHLRKTKNEQILREKYSFSLMKSMIDMAVNQYFECQVATKGNRGEPIKVTNIPNRPWGHSIPKSQWAILRPSL